MTVSDASDSTAGMGSDSEGSALTTGQSAFAFMEGNEVLVVGVVCSSVVIAAVVVVLVVSLLLRKRCTRREYDEQWLEDELEKNITRSAPNTRSSSPVSKRKTREQHSKEILRSVSAEMLPEITKEELVQPRRTDETISTTPLHAAQTYSTTNIVSQTVNNSVDMLDSLLDADTQASVAGLSPVPGSPPVLHSCLYYNLSYDAPTTTLTVTLLKVKGLKSRTGNVVRDPFVRIYLLSNENTVQQSRVHKQTNDPIFNETFHFKLSEDELPTQSLRMSVYDVDKKRLRHCLGHITVDLSQVDLSDNEVRIGNLDSESQTGAMLGELGITLEYSQADEQLWVAIMDVRDVKLTNVKRGSEIYMKVTLMQGGRHVVLCKRTSTQACLASQTTFTFNESLDFAINIKQLDSYSVHTSVILRTVGRKGGVTEEEYGRITIGSYLFARANTLLHWQDAVNNPRTPITMSHPIAPPPHNVLSFTPNNTPSDSD